MKNAKIRFRNITATALTLLALICLSERAVGQATVQGNTPAAGAFLGWGDNNNTFLNVKQDDLLRMRFRGVPYAPVGGPPTGLGGSNYTSASRILLDVEGDNTFNVITPYSMLHLHGSLSSTNIRRDWMHVGTTYTDEGDVFYVGLQQQPDDLYNPSGDKVVDATFAWGCNYSNESSGPDNMRFVFIRPTTVSGSPANTESGQEIARFTPEGHFGVGNFYTNGLDEQPTEQIDADGTMRLRQMPNNEPDVVITGVEADAAGDYVLNYSTLEDFIGEIDIPCDWDVVNGGDDVAMGFGGACVTEQMLVGTNLQTGTDAKVFMTKDYSGTTIRAEALVGDGTEIAGYFEAGNAANSFARGVYGEAHRSRRNVGVDGWAHDASQINYGFRGTAEDGGINFGGYGSATDANTRNYGLYGTATGSTGLTEPLENIGVYGEARGESTNFNFGGFFRACDGEQNIGVYAEVCDPKSQTDFAAYFVGNTLTTFSPLSLSDENLKTDIETIGGALDIIEELNPIQYHFATEQYPHVGMTDDLTFGFSAQEVQQILPTVVEQVVHPAKFDSSGEEISPSENLLGIQYQEFIAILTAGIKEQQAQIDEQEQTIDDLQQSLNNQNDLIAQMMDQMDALADQVNDCCEGGLKFNPMDEGHGDVKDKPAQNGNVLKQNIPNPFRSQTSISYTLEQGGKVLLNIFDKTGKPITTLVEAEQQAGEYRYEWDASGLPAGLYHYALYVDGELLVKKAIKLAD